MTIRLLHPLPGARVTQPFGPSSTSYPYWIGHAGIDYSAVVGTPVRAAHDGTCIVGGKASDTTGYGLYVMVETETYETIYAHLSSASVRLGQAVQAGDIIGETGNSGRSTGPHLHFGFRPLPADWDNGYSGWVDPAPYITEGDMLATLHVQRHQNWQDEVCRDLGSAWVKIVNPPLDRVLFPNVPRVLVRFWTDDIDAVYIRDGRAGGARFVRDMLPRWRAVPEVGAWELCNEPDCNSNAGLANLREYSIGAMEEAERHGLRLCILNLAEGNPHDNGGAGREVERWKWQQLVPAITRAVQGGHYVGLHAYWRPGVEGPRGRWHALGRRAWDITTLGELGVDVSRLEVLINECGIDGGIAPKKPGHAPGKGWRALSNADDYRADIMDMERYARTIAQRRIAFDAALKVRRLIKEIQSLLADAEAERMKLVEQYALRDEDGEMIRTNVSPDGSQWQYELSDPAVFQRAYAELLDTEVEVSATISTQDLERGGDIEPAVLIALGPLLTEG